MHFFLMGSALGLAASILVAFLKRYKEMNIMFMASVTAIFIVLALKTITFPLVSWGFFSQSAGMIGLLTFFLIETSPLLSEYGKQHRWQLAMIRTIPLIIVGQTWWVLSPIAIGFLGVRIFPVYVRSWKDKTWRSNIVPTCIYILGGLFSLLPAYVQLFVYNFDALDIVKIPGGIEKINIIHIIIYTSIVSACSGIALIVWRKKHPTALWAIFQYVTLNLVALISISVYQKNASGEFTYYSYKLAWSVAWIPFIASCTAIAFGAYYLGCYVIRLLGPRSITLRPLAISAIIAIVAYQLIIVASVQSSKLSQSTNPVQLADLAQGIENAENGNKILITVSDCAGGSDYYFQKAASTIQGRWTRSTYSYAVNALTVKDKDNYRLELLNSDPALFRVLDLTPLSDTNAPSDRLKVPNVEFERTRLDQTWSTERSTSQCQTDTINSIPEDSQ